MMGKLSAVLIPCFRQLIPLEKRASSGLEIEKMGSSRIVGESTNNVAQESAIQYSETQKTQGPTVQKAAIQKDHEVTIPVIRLDEKRETPLQKQKTSNKAPNAQGLEVTVGKTTKPQTSKSPTRSRPPIFSMNIPVSQRQAKDPLAKPETSQQIQINAIKLPKESKRQSAQIDESKVHSPSRTEKHAERHKKDVKNFVDSRITDEKIWDGQEAKVSPDSTMRNTQTGRFSLVGSTDRRPSPEVVRATSEARSRITEKFRELPIAITKNQGSLMERTNQLQENKHMVRSLVAVTIRKNQHHPKWNRDEQMVRDVVYTGSLRRKYNEQQTINRQNMFLANRLVNMNPTVRYSNMEDHLLKQKQLKELIKDRHLHDPDKHNFYVKPGMTANLSQRASISSQRINPPGRSPTSTANKFTETDLSRTNHQWHTFKAEDPFCLPTINQRNYSLMTQTAQPRKKRGKRGHSLRTSQRTRGEDEVKRTNYLTINVEENAVGQSVDAQAQSVTRVSENESLVNFEQQAQQSQKQKADSQQEVVHPAPTSNPDERFSGNVQQDSLEVSPRVKRRAFLRRRHHKTKSCNKQPVWDERFHITQQLQKSSVLDQTRSEDKYVSLRKSFVNRSHNMKAWKDMKMRKLGESTVHQDSIQSTVHTYMSMGGYSATPANKQLASKNMAKTARGTERFVKKLAKRKSKSPERLKQVNEPILQQNNGFQQQTKDMESSVKGLSTE